jgi:hypothetical protein
MNSIVNEKNIRNELESLGSSLDSATILLYDPESTKLIIPFWASILICYYPNNPYASFWLKDSLWEDVDILHSQKMLMG